MSDDVVHGALWANDLAGLTQPPELDGYAIAEVAGGLVDGQLATATGLAEREVRERFARGVRAWACWRRPDAELAAWVWVSTGREWAPPLCQMLLFAPDECYAFGGGTLSEHRSRGLLTTLLRWVAWRMAQAERRWMWAGIEDHNLPSQRAVTAAGWRPVLRLTAEHQPPPTRLSVRPADYADGRLVERAHRVLGVSDPTSPLAPATAHARRA